MKIIIKTFAVIVLYVSASLAQGFNVSASGEQNFSFSDKYGRNQATFFSTTPLEDINGLTNDVNGSVTFDVGDVSTLRGTISLSTASLKTGIDLRDEHLRSANWLDADSYPIITFAIKNVSNIESVESNKLTAKVTGDFTAHGIIKEITADVTMTYLDESEQTQKRAPGDLLGVQAAFNITLSDYEVDNMVLGQKVSDNIEIGVNIVGSNAK
ncbi:MAG: YceI family protein [Ignavibacteriaceae bacterium]|nr:YceI family protein [Ignavibacteriaceae bacterium]